MAVTYVADKEFVEKMVARSGAHIEIKGVAVVAGPGEKFETTEGEGRTITWDGYYALRIDIEPGADLSDFYKDVNT